MTADDEDDRGSISRSMMMTREDDDWQDAPRNVSNKNQLCGGAKEEGGSVNDGYAQMVI